MEALVVVDTQNEFSPEGAMAVEGHAAALEEIAGRVAAAREAGQPIAWIVHNNGADAERVRLGSWGAELSPGLEPAPGEPVFVKTVFGALTDARACRDNRRQGNRVASNRLERRQLPRRADAQERARAAGDDGRGYPTGGVSSFGLSRKNADRGA